MPDVNIKQLNDIDWKVPQNAYLLISILILIGGMLSFYQFIYVVKDQEITKLDSEVKEKKAILDNIQKQVAKKKSLENQLALSEQELEHLRSMFPNSELVINRLRDLYGAMTASGTDINHFQPSKLVQAKKDNLSPNNPLTYYNENFYDIEIQGGYHMVGQLFAEIANFKYPTTIFNLKIDPVTDLDKQIKNMDEQGWTPKTVKVVFQLSTFTSRK